MKINRCPVCKSVRISYLPWIAKWKCNDCGYVGVLVVEEKLRAVLDTSAIIYLNDFRNFDELITVDEVVDEVKDRISSMKLSSLKLKTIEPEKESIDKIKSVARETNDLEKMSKTDVKVLAAAFETNSVIISDDRNIQNVAEKLKIKYIPIFNKKIKKLIIWSKFCKNCRRFFDKKDNCPVCGSKLSRVPKEAKEINE